MDTSNLLFGAVVIALCLFPFALMRISSKKREKIILAPFKKLVDAEGGKITKIDVEKDFVIGADEHKKLVFFHTSLPGNMEQHTVDLNTIQRCELVQISRTSTKNNDVYKVIDKLALKLVPKKEGIPAVNIQLYDSDRSFQIGEELVIANKWHEVINNVLKN
jgi:hypothetical protein